MRNQQNTEAFNKIRPKSKQYKMLTSSVFTMICDVKTLSVHDRCKWRNFPLHNKTIHKVLVFHLIRIYRHKFFKSSFNLVYNRLTIHLPETFMLCIQYFT